MFTYPFWRSTFERAFKTFTQTLVALLSVGGIGLHNAPWSLSLSAAGMAALLSMFTSMASEPLGERHTPSLLHSAPPAAQPVPAAQPAPTTSVPA